MLSMSLNEDERLRHVVDLVAARVVARLQEDVTPQLARLLASAGEDGELRLVDGTGRVLRRWRSAEEFSRELVGPVD